LLQSAISPWRVSFIACGLVVLTCASRKFRLSVIITALLLGSMVMSFRQASLQNSQLTTLYGQSAEVMAQVVTDPNHWQL